MTRILPLTVLLILCSCTCDSNKAPQASSSSDKCPEGAYMTGNDTEKGCKMKDTNGNFIQHGPWSEFYLNGALHMKGNYYKGMRDGVWTWWYPNGKKMQQGYFVHGHPSDSWIQWDENGNRIKRFEGDTSNTNDVVNFGNSLKSQFGN